MLKRRRTEQDELLIQPRRSVAPPRMPAPPARPAPANHRGRSRGPSLLCSVAILRALAGLLYLGLPLALRANRLRPVVEQTLCGILGRPVRVGSLSYTIGLGGLVATDVVPAEDPAFGSTPFAHVEKLTLSARRLALLFGGRVEISSVELTRPTIHLIRDAAHRWNITSLLASGTLLNDGGPPVLIREGGRERG